MSLGRTSSLRACSLIPSTTSLQSSFLPSAALGRCSAYARDAVARALQKLPAPSLDLLILSCFGVTFDADEDEEEDTCAGAAEEDARQQLDKMPEELHAEGVVDQLGLPEFCSDPAARRNAAVAGPHQCARLMRGARVACLRQGRGCPAPNAQRLHQHPARRHHPRAAGCVAEGRGIAGCGWQAAAPGRYVSSRSGSSSAQRWCKIAASSSRTRATVQWPRSMTMLILYPSTRTRNRVEYDSLR